ncbi:phosphotransferase [Sphingobacterium faecale]|uniref:phosphotransferase n=1 Tax=Sphingobacterium faecale TaxID=2803775 RepID=UPI0037427040
MVTPEGNDNSTFRLGDTILVRLPNAELFASQIEKEAKWLPFLAQKLSTPIPHPLGMGKSEYPYSNKES